MTESAVVYTDPGVTDGPLVTVSFQKNSQRKLKFLEGEPKALGIAQIGLVVFHNSCVASLVGDRTGLATPCFITSVFVFIAGSVAIAAKNLHLPTIRACLGLEIVATLASVINLIFTFVLMVHPLTFGRSCYYAEKEAKQSCLKIEEAHSVLFAELIIVQLVLLAISVTLACYAGKVVNCCCPPPKVPVIMLQAPPAAQTDPQ
ncbi:unnamed protein product [Knipowitschia caucasica]|uniref:Membrane-spanning 4-domains subfamily A member 4A-like n=1 Tax=Knipowitschia caucasica TaxID=637954 RepID=A0AAV2KP13_KNICA